MSHNGILKISNLQIKKQRGFSLSGMLLSLTTAGAITAAALPSITETVNEADHSTLTYARGALISALQVNRLLSQLEGGTQIEIEGQTVNLRNGFPLATAENIKAYATLDGFDIDEFGTQLRIWSPGREYCMIYEEVTAKNPRASVSDLALRTENICTDNLS